MELMNMVENMERHMCGLRSAPASQVASHTHTSRRHMRGCRQKGWKGSLKASKRRFSPGFTNRHEEPEGIRNPARARAYARPLEIPSKSQWPHVYLIRPVCKARSLPCCKGAWLAHLASRPTRPGRRALVRHARPHSHSAPPHPLKMRPLAGSA